MAQSRQHVLRVLVAQYAGHRTCVSTNSTAACAKAHASAPVICGLLFQELWGRALSACLGQWGRGDPRTCTLTSRAARPSSTVRRCRSRKWRDPPACMRCRWECHGTRRCALLWPGRPLPTGTAGLRTSGRSARGQTERANELDGGSKAFIGSRCYQQSAYIR
jgi:hypothetical protein